MMKELVAILLTTFLLGVTAHTQEKADFIIVNAKMSTPDRNEMKYQAVAVANRKILQVGSQIEILRFRGKHSVMIDARGRTVIPGIFDSHLHVIRGGRFYNSELRWDGVKTVKRALEMLKEQAARTPEGQWVRVVGGWNEYQFAEKRLPTPEEINEATGKVPAFILYLYGKAWLNKAGLKKLDINGATPNPPGGLIQKDSDGVPTGLLLAEPNAFVLYSTLAKLPELTPEEKINSSLQYMTELNRLGVTAVMDAGGGFQNFPDDYVITDSLYKAGKLTLRIPYFLFAQKKGSEVADYTKWISIVDLHHPPLNNKNSIQYHVQGGGENLVAEAADFENFLFPRPELPDAMDGRLKEVISLLVKNRWPFRLHATYNESISRFLTVIEAVNKETPLNGLTWIIDHAETISDENILRIKSMGGGISIQHRIAYQGETFIHRYGKSAAMASPPVKKMIAAGLPVGLGTDGTRVASFNPWIALYWITTGKTIGGVQVMGTENTLTRTEALGLFTTGSYSLIKEEKIKGKIEKGFAADLVILNKDYFTVDEIEIPSISSLLTMVDGKVVYALGDYEVLSPPRLQIIPAWSPVKFYGGYQYR
jgi:predicted amidohydrolase YtcJ